MLYALLSQSTEQRPRQECAYKYMYAHREYYGWTFVKWLLLAKLVTCPVGPAQRTKTKTLLPPDCS